MHYTEAVYKNNNDSTISRILESILIPDGKRGLLEGVLTVNTKGEKIAYTKSYFDEQFYLYDAGESPASKVLKD